MNPNNHGSFGAAIGGMSPELQAAMSSRQGNPAAGATQQVSGQAAYQAPQTPPPPTALPQAQGMGAVGQGAMGGSLTGNPEEGMGQQPLTNAGVSPAPFDPAEVKLILSAMNGRMKAISRLQGDMKG